jgi:hypothetical protein
LRHRDNEAFSRGCGADEIPFTSGFSCTFRTLTIHLTRARMEAFLDTAASSAIELRFRDGAARSAALLA